MSDHRVSLRRSSKGKSKSVASIIVVSSIDTVSTQSKVSPSGRESSTRRVRSRMIGSSLTRLRGATAGRTVLRCSVCRGGSWEMNGGVPNRTPSGSLAPTRKAQRDPVGRREGLPIRADRLDVVVLRDRPVPSSGLDLIEVDGILPTQSLEVLLPAILAEQMWVDRVDVLEGKVLSRTDVAALLGLFLLGGPVLSRSPETSLCRCLAHLSPSLQMSLRSGGSLTSGGHLSIQSLQETHSSGSNTGWNPELKKIPGLLMERAVLTAPQCQRCCASGHSEEEALQLRRPWFR